MLGDDLETIVLWSFQGLDHCVIDDLTDRLAVFHRFALSEFDASEWHGNLLSDLKRRGTARQFRRAAAAESFTTSDSRRPALLSAFLSAFLGSAVIPPGVGRHFGHDDVSRGMKIGANNAFEKSHCLLDE